MRFLIGLTTSTCIGGTQASTSSQIQANVVRRLQTRQQNPCWSSDGDPDLLEPAQGNYNGERLFLSIFAYIFVFCLPQQLLNCFVSKKGHILVSVTTGSCCLGATRRQQFRHCVVNRCPVGNVGTWIKIDESKGLPVPQDVVGGEIRGWNPERAGSLQERRQ